MACFRDKLIALKGVNPVTLGERIKKARKALDLTQQEFANRIGTTQNVLANYESGRRNPSASAFNNICKTFNIHETWLRTGEGEMFVPQPTDTLEAFIRERGLSVSDRILIEKFAALDTQSRQAVVAFVLSAVDNLLNAPATPTLVPPAGTDISVSATAPDPATELAELKRQNLELAAKVAAMEKEDARMEVADGSSTWAPSGGGTKLA